jgi:hypothetical protein
MSLTPPLPLAAPSLLLHVKASDLPLVLQAPASRSGAGLVLQRPAVRDVRIAGACVRGAVVVDPGVWTQRCASPGDPWPSGTEAPGLIPRSLDDIAAP